MASVRSLPVDAVSATGSRSPIRATAAIPNGTAITMIAIGAPRNATRLAARGGPRVAATT